MLNGIAPILIFTFPVLEKGPTFNAISGIPVVGESLANIGLPIPIYLDEKLTGIYVDSESKSIDIETAVEDKLAGGTPDYAQRGINNSVTINMKALKTSITLSALLALIDLVFQKVVSQEYKVTYLNGPTTIFNGLLDGFSVNNDNDTDLMTMTLTLSKANQKIKKTDLTPVVPKGTPVGL